jgi:tetratricopeptide (TPR) repeat protein
VRALWLRCSTSFLDLHVPDEPADPSLDVTLPARTVASDRSPSTPLVGGATPAVDDYGQLQPVLPAHYVVLRELARGGMGRILAAHDRRLGRPVALKQLLVGTDELRARFEREIRLTAKLQHPGVVTVLEAGTFPDSGPFYAMPLVAGRSLDAALARHSSWQTRLALLPNVLAAVEALAYAHSQGVIHRDLKPSNVLVGDFGETVVIDWGLAKSLAEPDPGALAVDGSRATSSGGATEAGAIIGTPAYMPPEQASGGVVDARADVYSLGAMLYHLLAGAHPYEGQTGAALSAVLDGPPPELSTRVEGVPPDLLAIVTKAMSRRSADRYPTARELGDDLRRFQTGQLVGAHAYSSGELLRRWARRQKKPLTVAVAAALVLLAGGVTSVRRIIAEQAQTERQRGRAEEHRVAAENLLDFMLTDLRDKLAEVGRLELLDAVAQKAIDYYGQRSDPGQRDDALRQARAHQSISDVLKARGDLAGAAKEAGLALTLCDGALQGSPNDPLVLDRLTQVVLTQGDLQVAQGDSAGALASYERASALAARPELTGTEGGNRLRSRCASSLGDHFLAQGELERAEALFRKALALDEAVGGLAPDDVERLRAALVGHERLGNVLERQAEHDAALGECRQVLVMAEGQVARAPLNTSYQRDLSIAHERIGNVLKAQKDFAGSLTERRASLAIDERLAQLDPTNVELQFDLTISKEKLAWLLQAQHQLDDAIHVERQVLAQREALATRSPENATITFGLFTTHRALGEFLGEHHDLPGALAQYQGAKAVALALTAKDPGNAQWQGVLAEASCGLGRVLDAQRRFGPAVEATRACISTWRAQLVAEPTNHDFRQRLGLALAQLGDTLDDSGQPAQALPAYREALAAAQLAAEGLHDAVDGQQVQELEAAIRDCEKRAHR